MCDQGPSSPPPPDSEGDPSPPWSAEAFRGWYEVRAPLIRSAVRVPGLRPSDREDAFQSAWLAILARLPGFQPDTARGSVSTWMFTIARRVALNLRGSARRQPFLGLTERDEVDLVDPRVGPVEAEPDQFLVVLTRLLESSSPETRAIAERSWMLRESPRVIAGALGLPPGRVRARLHRLRVRLRAQLSETNESPDLDGDPEQNQKKEAPGE